MLSICQYVDLNKCNKTNLLHSLNTFFNYSDRPIMGTYSESAKNGLFRQIDILGQITFCSWFALFLFLEKNRMKQNFVILTKNCEIENFIE